MFFLSVGESTMSVKTNLVRGRRRLRFDSYGDVLFDAELIVAGESLLLGNWSRGQILHHLALSMHASLDAFMRSARWRRRVPLLRLFV